jgi:hypothetical protein
MDNTNELNKEISGRYIESILAAYAAFKKEQNNIDDFSIQIKDNGKEIKITFNPNLTKGERVLGGKTSLGRSVTYTVSKEKMRLSNPIITDKIKVSAIRSRFDLVFTLTDTCPYSSVDQAPVT